MTENMTPPQEACFRFLFREYLWRLTHPIDLTKPVEVTEDASIGRCIPLGIKMDEMPVSLRPLLQRYRKEGWTTQWAQSTPPTIDFCLQRRYEIIRLRQAIDHVRGGKRNLAVLVWLLESMAVWVDTHQIDCFPLLHPQHVQEDRAVLHRLLHEWRAAFDTISFTSLR